MRPNSVLLVFTRPYNASFVPSSFSVDDVVTGFIVSETQNLSCTEPAFSFHTPHQNKTKHSSTTKHNSTIRYLFSNPSILLFRFSLYRHVDQGKHISPRPVSIKHRTKTPPVTTPSTALSAAEQLRTARCCNRSNASINKSPDHAETIEARTLRLHGVSSPVHLQFELMPV